MLSSLYSWEWMSSRQECVHTLSSHLFAPKNLMKNAQLLNNSQHNECRPNIIHFCLCLQEFILINEVKLKQHNIHKSFPEIKSRRMLWPGSGIDDKYPGKKK